jgi:hypothetical protein
MMDGAGTRHRERFIEAMKAVAPGARLKRRLRVWTIQSVTRRDTSVDLLLRHGRRTFVASVPVCITGPCLHEAGLRSVAHAPVQRPLSLGGE